MADLLDVLTLAEGYRAVNDPASATAGTGNHDTALAQAITSISRRLDELVGPIVNRSVTEYHDGGRVTIWPHQTPVSSVTTLKEWDGSTTTTLSAETFGVDVADGYLLDNHSSYAHSCRIVRRESGADSVFPAGRRNVELVYVAGRAADTAAVDARIKGVAASILNAVWDREAARWARGSDPFDDASSITARGFFNAVDRRVAEMLHDEMKPPAVA